VKFLVDADVLSEPTKLAPHPAVVAWLRENEADLAVSSIVLGEIEYGILLLPAGKKRERLHKWFVDGAQRVTTLDFDRHTASVWATLLARLKGAGRSMPIKDSLIAGTALAYGLTVATRNTADYKHAGVPLANPFEARRAR
jgi:predicted nucleic acid-binding protein